MRLCLVYQNHPRKVVDHCDTRATHQVSDPRCLNQSRTKIGGRLSKRTWAGKRFCEWRVPNSSTCSTTRNKRARRQDEATPQPMYSVYTYACRAGTPERPTSYIIRLETLTVLIMAGSHCRHFPPRQTLIPCWVGMDLLPTLL